MGLGERDTERLPWDNVVCDALYPRRGVGGAELVLLLTLLLDGVLFGVLCIVRAGLFGVLVLLFSRIFVFCCCESRGTRGIPLGGSLGLRVSVLWSILMTRSVTP